TAPAGTAPTGVTNADVCMIDAEEVHPFDAATVALNYSDNCSDVTVILTDTSLTGDNCNWTLIYTYDVFDSCGNALQNETITHTGSDQTSPVIDTDAQNMTVECDGSGNSAALLGWLNSNGGAVASDMCGDVSWSNDFTGLSDECGATGSATVVFTATDECGNTSSTTA